MNTPVAVAVTAAALAVAADIPIPQTPMDWAGLSALVVAIGVLVGQVMTARANAKAQAVKDAIAAEERADIKAALAETKAEAKAAKEQVVLAQSTFDGGLDKLMRKVEEGGVAKGKAGEKEAQAGREQIATEAVAGEQARVAATTTAAGEVQKVQVVAGPDPGEEAVRTKTDPKEAAEAAHAAAEVAASTQPKEQGK